MLEKLYTYLSTAFTKIVRPKNICNNIFCKLCMYNAEDNTFHINPLDRLRQARCNRIEQQTTKSDNLQYNMLGR